MPFKTLIEERHAQLPIYTTVCFQLTNVEKFKFWGYFSCLQIHHSLTRTPKSACDKRGGTWGKNLSCKIGSRHIKKFSPFTTEDILDISLGDDVVITLEPVVPLLPNVGSVVTSLQ
jgi:hypothetical protein